MRVALAALCVAALGACHPAVPPNGVTAADAIVYLKSNVRDAQLYVDGRFVAPLNALGGGVAVDPGPHRFELRHGDYFSHYFELTLARAERKRLTVELFAEILP